jgi:ATP-dependent DNA helicase RecG
LPAPPAPPSSTATILDRHDFDGDVLELIEEAEKYILKNIHIGMRLEGMRRVDVPEIARAALREAIINAFCHRDWRHPDYIQIAIYKNRVEIRNPGGLFDGLTFEEMRRGNVSHRRNPLIADLFRRIEMVEAWGRGMPLILANAPDVEFREIAQLFVASFERPSAAVEVTPETGLAPPENHKKTTRKPLENPKKTLLALLQQQPDTSIRALAEQTGLNQASVRHHLERMQTNSMLRRVGPAKGGYWEILDPIKKEKP